MNLYIKNNLCLFVNLHKPLLTKHMITTEQLAAHKKWIEGHPGGQRLILHSADLRCANFSSANLSSADLSDADLRGAILRDTNLSSANLSRADFSGAVLRNANMQNAILNGADFSQAVLDGVNLSHANLQCAKLDFACITNANLSNADLTHANLRNADLRNSDLNNTDLRNADLRYILFRCADLTNVKGLPIAADAPERLKAVASAALQCDALNMDAWHTCDTQHCIAGWAVDLAGEPGRIIESMMGTEIAGLYLLGIEAHAHFFKNDKEAKEFLQNVLASTSK